MELGSAASKENVFPAGQSDELWLCFQNKQKYIAGPWLLFTPNICHQSAVEEMLVKKKCRSFYLWRTMVQRCMGPGGGLVGRRASGLVMET